MSSEHKLIRNNSGAAYVLALVTLLVGSILALAMLRASAGYYLAEQTRFEKRAATNLAEAGVDYALWQVHCKRAHLPYSCDVTLANGSFHVEVSDDGTREQSSMRIVSRGTSNGQTCTVRRTTLGPLPYQYCWCENVGVDDGDILLSSGAGCGIRSNGKIKVTNAATQITNGGWSYTVFEGAGTVTPGYTSTPKIRFPAIDTAYYASIAAHVFGSPGSPTSVSVGGLSGSGGVVLVYGDIDWMQGITYTGVWTVVATDDITLGCPIVAADSDSYLALVAGGNINIYTSDSVQSDRLDAVVYAPQHNINLRGNQYGLGIRDNDITINGAMACNDFTTSGDGGSLVVRMNWDPRLTVYVLRDRLKMPGL